MEGTLTPRAKRKPKKPKVVDPPVEMQTTFPMNPSLMAPTMNPVNSSFPGNPFIKPEPGTQNNSALGQMPYVSQPVPENMMQGQQYFPLDYASMQFQQAVTMQPGPSSSIDTNPSSSINPYPIEAMPTSYPYMPSGLPSSFGGHDLGMQVPYHGRPADITWGQQGPSNIGDQVIKSEEMQLGTSIMDWVPTPPVLPDASTTRPEDQHRIDSIDWEPQPCLQQNAPAPTPDDQTQTQSHAHSSSELLVTRQDSPVIKVDEQQQNTLASSWGNELQNPRDIPVPRSIEQPPKEEKVTWVSMPPPPPPPQFFPDPQDQIQAKSCSEKIWSLMPLLRQQEAPAELEVENPSTALVLWRPQAPSQETMPATQIGDQQVFNSTPIWRSLSPGNKAIQIINLEDDEPGESAGVVKSKNSIV